MATNRSLSLALCALTGLGCASGPAFDPLDFEGRVTGVYANDGSLEDVIVCDEAPFFIVAVNTADGEKRLGIHSPVMAFGLVDPVGKIWHFKLAEGEDRHHLIEVTLVDSDPPASEDDAAALTGDATAMAG